MVGERSVCLSQAFHTDWGLAKCDVFLGFYADLVPAVVQHVELSVGNYGEIGVCIEGAGQDAGLASVEANGGRTLSEVEVSVGCAIAGGACVGRADNADEEADCVWRGAADLPRWDDELGEGACAGWGADESSWWDFSVQESGEHVAQVPMHGVACIFTAARSADLLRRIVAVVSLLSYRAGARVGGWIGDKDCQELMFGRRRRTLMVGDVDSLAGIWSSAIAGGDVRVTKPVPLSFTVRVVLKVGWLGATVSVGVESIAGGFRSVLAVCVHVGGGVYEFRVSFDNCVFHVLPPMGQNGVGGCAAVWSRGVSALARAYTRLILAGGSDIKAGVRHGG